MGTVLYLREKVKLFYIAIQWRPIYAVEFFTEVLREVPAFNTYRKPYRT